MVNRIILGGGCFWCLDAAYRLVRGISDITSGYAGGHTANPNYYQVCSETTGHAEVVQVKFDPNIVTLEQILDIFWTIHDPTSLNAQGADIGSQYRSIILYEGHQLATIEKSLARAQKLFDRPIVTEIKPLDEFYSAEAEHQDYFQKNPEQAYCQIVINPKLAKLRATLQPLLK